MTENGIILNNEMADFSIPGVTKIGWDGPPTVGQKVSHAPSVIFLWRNFSHFKSPLFL